MVVACGIALILARAWIRHREELRYAKFIEQLPDVSRLLANATANVLHFKTDSALPGPLAVQARVTGRIVELPAHDPAEIERHLAALREAAVAVEDIEIRKADLEDVFIQLMAGQGAGAPAAVEAAR